MRQARLSLGGRANERQRGSEGDHKEGETRRLGEGGWQTDGKGRETRKNFSGKPKHILKFRRMFFWLLLVVYFTFLGWPVDCEK